jgi:hypothetical protein
LNILKYATDVEHFMYMQIQYESFEFKSRKVDNDLFNMFKPVPVTEFRKALLVQIGREHKQFFVKRRMKFMIMPFSWIVSFLALMVSNKDQPLILTIIEAILVVAPMIYTVSLIISYFSFLVYLLSKWNWYTTAKSKFDLALTFEEYVNQNPWGV